jgi:CheY-like chemotaxis protein
LSQRGVFVRTSEYLPDGTVTNLEVTLPDGKRFKAVARVAHRLTAKEARTLGRKAGLGFHFLEYNDSGYALTHYINELEKQDFTDKTAPSAGAQVLIADPNDRLLERLGSGSLGMHYRVTAVKDGAEAFAECLEAPPDVVLCCTDDLPGINGWELLRRIRAKDNIAHIPVMLMADDAGDLIRLQAYRMGAADFIPKPFTDEELCIRLGRVLRLHEPRGGHTIRGKLHDISVGTLLSLFDFERKSGILVLRDPLQTARLFISEGRIIKIDSSDVGLPKDVMLRLLDWNNGEFEFSACEVVGKDSLEMTTTGLLLEHARLRDEDSKFENTLSDGDDPRPLDDAFGE